MSVQRDAQGRVLPGSKLNDEGRNQYSYRARVQGELDDLLKADWEDGGTVSRALLDRIIEDALNGAAHAQRLVWTSLVPKLEEHHVTQQEVSTGESVAALQKALGEIDRNTSAEEWAERERHARERGAAAAERPALRPGGNGRDYDA